MNVPRLTYLTPDDLQRSAEELGLPVVRGGGWAFLTVGRTLYCAELEPIGGAA